MTTKDMVAEVSEESEPTETRADVRLERDDDAAEGELDLLELVRERLGLDDDISDMTIASSLAAIAAQSEQPDRWLAAVASPLGSLAPTSRPAETPSNCRVMRWRTAIAAGLAASSRRHGRSFGFHANRRACRSTK